MVLPPRALPLLGAPTPAFSRPTFDRLVFLMAAAIPATGRRAVANLLRTAAPPAAGHRTSYQRVFSCASWSALQPACCTCRFAISASLRDETIGPSP